ncbi:hypothetical protein CONPUDRAFT_19782, partial [Coniophora puteana RWD-64-598 SS2]
TGSRMGKLPLVVGMPVMIMHNFDVESGVVNGLTGILVNVRYRLDDDGNRHALSCVVRSPDSLGAGIPGLPSDTVVALEDATRISFEN